MWLRLKKWGDKYIPLIWGWCLIITITCFGFGLTIYAFKWLLRVLGVM